MVLLKGQFTQMKAPMSDFPLSTLLAFACVYLDFLKIYSDSL